jgi:hypothetical protein
MQPDREYRKYLEGEMTILDWLIIGAVWMLIPICLLLKAKQDKKFARWRQQDEQILREYYPKFSEPKWRIEKK